MPVIGITSTSKNGKRIRNYVKAIRKFGGEPRIFAAPDSSIRTDLASISEYLSHIDGLLLPGGGDIDPSVYSQKTHPTIRGVNPSLDALERQLFQKALEADVPVFGICRGIQIMSVAMGGELYQDIEDTVPRETLSHTRRRDGTDSQHEIKITDGSLLHGLIGKSVSTVNSSHHQAVNAVGEELVVTARSPADGIIEAIEHPDKRFMLGVQYHPERMFKKSEMDEHAVKLFEAFIEAAS